MSRCTSFVIAAAIAALAIAPAVAQKPGQAQTLLEAAKQKETLQGDLAGAIRQYQAVVDQFAKTDRAAAAQALVAMAECYRKLGDSQARSVYERIVREFGDQKEAAALARGRLSDLNAAATATSPVAGIVARELWSGEDAWAPSLDGRLLPFTRRGRVAVRDLTTGTDRELKPEAGYAVGAGVLTPDGRRIIYLWQEGLDRDRQLKVADGDGRNVRILHTTKVGGQNPDGLQWPWPYAVTPDGSAVAVIAGAKTGRVIALINLATSAVTVVKSLPASQIALGNFSPDGRYLTYSIRIDPSSLDREVRLLAVDGSTDVLLVGPRGNHMRPIFTPDGSRVVFASNRTAGRWDLWAIRVLNGQPDGTPEIVKSDSGPMTALGFARDGTFYYAEGVASENAFLVDLDPSTGNAKGTPKPVSPRFPHSSYGPTWSPDGTYLAYAAYTDRVQARADVTIVVRSTDTGKERDFTVPYTNPYNARYSRWFPDSKSILLIDGDSKTRTFRRFDITTGDVRLLFDAPPAGAFRTHIDPDGRAVSYRLVDQAPSPNGGSGAVTHWVRRNLETGEQHSVWDGPAIAVNPSPDGRSLAFIEKNEGPSFVVTLADGHTREVWAPTGMSFQGGGAAWTPDSRGLYLGMFRVPSATAPPDAHDPLEVWYVPLTGGQPHRIGVWMPFLNSLSVRPDGAQLGFSGNASTSHVWSVKGLFPPPLRSAK